MPKSSVDKNIDHYQKLSKWFIFHGPHFGPDPQVEKHCYRPNANRGFWRSSTTEIAGNVNILVILVYFTSLWFAATFLNMILGVK